MGNITELKDTIDMMISDDHYERLMAEYFQLRIRYQKLSKMIYEYDMGTLSFTPQTPIHILKDQCNLMKDYLSILNQRLHIEDGRTET